MRRKYLKKVGRKVSRGKSEKSRSTLSAKGLGKKVGKNTKKLYKTKHKHKNPKTKNPNIMNCKQANENISIREILESFSLFPSKDNRKSAFYYAFDRKERTPSLVVNFNQNTAFDFGTGMKYDNVSLVQGIKNCSVSEALEYLKRFDNSIPTTQKINSNDFQPKSGYQILEIKEVEHPSLMEYLKSRKLESQKSELKEIHYELNGKNYYGLGFKNDSDGYEVRNPYIKICLGKKDLTSIKNQSKILRIFEGFSDYLSFKILEKPLEKEASGYVILNSVSMISKVKNQLENYENIELYLDNDRTGDSVTETLKNENPNVSDERILFKNYKDLNEFLINGNLRKRDTGLEEKNLRKIDTGIESEDLGKITPRKIGR
ncbi:toprim domain-containing protein [Epilithonimonas vandammei]|uniref:toprim domain-containing protein n=1 Tax=Epilithonimonas vandammei TaxID=2487072 RepID=UPI00262C3BEB|nr:toprim domain-containing protein [Epilithonimonas vandammei]